jgi:hypothetical protein
LLQPTFAIIWPMLAPPDSMSWAAPTCAAEETRSISDVIHEVASLLVSKDAEDIADFDARIGEPNVGYDEFVQSLKAGGII